MPRGTLVWLLEGQWGRGGQRTLVATGGFECWLEAARSRFVLEVLLSTEGQPWGEGR